ncbi:MAG: aldehyde-activating protein [Rhodospirillales bacterium]|nr:aldehyde-activating protein [Rhodospirillales bacterium]
MKIDGQCHCGHVSYEAEIDPQQVSICHCTDCQMLTGSAFRVTVLAARADIRLTANQPKLYTKTGDNGLKRLQFFCPECGSPLFTTGEGEEAAIWGIRWGSIRQRRALAPKRRIWCRSAPAWLHDIDGLPGAETE